jgi:hypothetical protein
MVRRMGRWNLIGARPGTLSSCGRMVGGLAAGVLLCMACPSWAGAFTDSSSPENLLVDSGAEEAGGSGVPGWTGTSGYTTTLYGEAGEYPSLAVSESMTGGAEPPYLGGGYRFFDPGTEPTATLTQVVDLSSHAATIDEDQETIDFGGWLGGYGSSPDTVDMVVTPLDGDGDPTSEPWVLYGPTAAQREDRTMMIDEAWDNIHGWRETGESEYQLMVPPGTRSVRVELVARENESGESKNHGYADELSLSVLHRQPPGFGSPAPGVGGALPEGAASPPNNLLGPGQGIVVRPTVRAVRRMALERRHRRTLLNTGIVVGCPSGGPPCEFTATASGPMSSSIAGRASSTLIHIHGAVASGSKGEVTVLLPVGATRSLARHPHPRMRVDITATRGATSPVRLTRTATVG